MSVRYDDYISTSSYAEDMVKKEEPTWVLVEGVKFEDKATTLATCVV